jgi:hypothetical protein
MFIPDLDYFPPDPETAVKKTLDSISAPGQKFRKNLETGVAEL